MTDLRKAAEDLLEGVKAAIKAGDWQVDGACDPDSAIIALRQALAEPEQNYVIDCPRCGHCCPERQWVGLEPQEIGQIWFKHKEVYGFGIELEQVLKGRNE